MNFNQIDHVLFGGNELTANTEHLQKLTGIAPVKGGSHPGKGTQNYLLGLSHDVYLEIIGPDQDQVVEKYWMNLDKKASPSLFRWAAKCDNLEELVERAKRQGIDLGEIQRGSRQKPDGGMLEWQLTNPDVVLGDGLIPFFIDWGEAGNPTSSLPSVGQIESFYGLHPEPKLVKGILSKLGLDMEVRLAEKPGLCLEFNQNGHLLQLT